jgi:3-hydroxybutyrate dehydrogenase
MTDDEFELTEPELTAEDVLVVADPHFDPDSVAVVTGGASGIGQATAVSLAHNGLTVLAADIDADGSVDDAPAVAATHATGDDDATPNADRVSDDSAIDDGTDH